MAISTLDSGPWGCSDASRETVHLVSPRLHTSWRSAYRRVTAAALARSETASPGAGLTRAAMPNTTEITNVAISTVAQVIKMA